MNDDLVYWVALSRVEGVGRKTLDNLLDRFDTAEDIFAADDSELLEIPRVTGGIVSGLRQSFDTVPAIAEELYQLDEEGVSVLAHPANGYPPNLARAHDAPPILYVRGSLRSDDDFAAAIVGSRSASEEGLELARQLAHDLAAEGVTIVSGLALGIDGAAHVGALEGEGRTIGVLGSGIRVIHPLSHAALAQEMVERGALLSELEPNTSPSGRNLMARDRIISGLSLGVIVVEAAARSGTMDTARRAEKQDRTLFAVEWSGMAEGAAGNRALLRGGATPIDAEEPPPISLILAELKKKQDDLASSNAEEVQMTLFD